MSYLKSANIKVFAFMLLIIGILGYAYFQTYNLIIGPVVTITSPIDGDTLSSPKLIVSGTTRNISLITFNDRTIFVDEAGAFEEKLLLAPGYTILNIHAEDKFGRTTDSSLHVIYNQS
jgi:hypothetical protein